MLKHQYEKRWSSQIEKSATLSLPELPEIDPEILESYSKIIVKVHPFLGSVSESERRTRSMRKADHALIRKDEMALEAMVNMYYGPEQNLPAIIDTSVVDTVRQQVFALEEAISVTESRIFEFQYGDIARIRQKVEVARNDGQDLLRELSSQTPR